jgi:uncharacterized protein DUF6293
MSMNKTEGSSQKVHILSIGREFAERALAPFDKDVTIIERNDVERRAYHPDRIYLFDHVSQIKRFAQEYQKTLDYLKTIIASPEDIITRKVDFLNLTDVMKNYARIFREEQALGNTIYINISIGGKLMAIAGWWAAQLFGGVDYYLKMDWEKGGLAFPLTMVYLPDFKMYRPEEGLVQALVIIEAYEGEEEGCSNTNILSGLKKFDKYFENPKTTKAAKFNQLKKYYVEPAIKDEYIKDHSRRGGRAVFRLTKKGKVIAQIFGEYYGIKYSLPSKKKKN